LVELFSNFFHLPISETKSGHGNAELL